VVQDRSAGSALLGLEGLRLLAVSQVEGEVELAMETNAGEDACRSCGVLAVAHGRQVVLGVRGSVRRGGNGRGDIARGEAQS